MLTVYHGSTYRVEQPLAGVCRPNLDFGVGFYLTDLKDQAIRWALRTADIRHENSVWLNIYSLDIDACRNSSFNYLHFTTYDAHWLDFVVACRQGNVIWQDYDIIEGGIADDRVIRTIDLYMRGDYTREEALSRLIHQEPNNQIVMQGKYYSIVELLATRLHISSLQALDIFYNSESYQRIVHRLGDLYLMSDAYIVDELMRELQKRQG